MADGLEVNHRLMRLMKGDLLDLEVEGIVYYARPDLMLGSGFGGAIGVRGGPKIQEELKKFGRVPVTETVITSGGNLKAKYIFHAVGPRFQEENLEEKLRDTIINVLRKADEIRVQSLAFPAMGAGFYGVPLDVCAQITLRKVKEYLKNETHLREVVFSLRDSREYESFQKKMREMMEPSSR